MSDIYTERIVAENRRWWVPKWLARLVLRWSDARHRTPELLANHETADEWVRISGYPFFFEERPEEETT